MKLKLYISFLIIFISFQIKAQTKTIVNEEELIKTAVSVYKKEFKKLDEKYKGEELFKQFLRVTLEEYKTTKTHKNDITNLENEYNVIIEDLQKELNQMNESLKNAKKDNDKLKANEGLDEKVDSLENEITLKNTSFDTITNQLNDAIEEKERLTNTITNIQNQLLQKNTEITQLKEQLINMQQEQGQLQSKYDGLIGSAEALDQWKVKVIADYNKNYENISSTSLSDIDTSAITTIIKSVGLLNSFPGKEAAEINKRNSNLENLKSLVTDYATGVNTLNTSANKALINNAAKNINTATTTRAWSLKHKDELKSLLNLLNGYGRYIDNFSSVLQLVEDIQKNPENKDKDWAKSLKAEKIEELKDDINIKIGLVSNQNYPASYKYLNSLLTELRNSLSQFPNIDISKFRTRIK